jgi:hypothetical protein
MNTQWLFSQATKALEDSGNVKEAKRILKTIVRESPASKEARDAALLLKKLNSFPERPIGGVERVRGITIFLSVWPFLPLLLIFVPFWGPLLLIGGVLYKHLLIWCLIGFTISLISANRRACQKNTFAPMIFNVVAAFLYFAYHEYIVPNLDKYITNYGY